MSEFLRNLASTAEDGLDPVDALTAEEALARILCDIRDFPCYDEHPSLKRALTLRRDLDKKDRNRWTRPCLLLNDWSNTEKRTERYATIRNLLEEVGLIAKWQ